jgi:DNA-directed RNA polymerase specialized sigma24 family protein
MIERYCAELLGFFLRRTRSKEQAADLVQEAYNRVLAAPGSTISQPRALLYRIAHAAAVRQRQLAGPNHAGV